MRRLLGELGDGGVLLVLGERDVLADLQELPDVGGVAVQREAPGKLHVGAARTHDLGELDPLVLLALLVLALAEELLDVVGHAVERGAAGVLDVGPAHTHDLGDSDPVVLLHRSFPAVVQEVAQRVRGSEQSCASSGKHFRTAPRSDPGGGHPLILEVQVLCDREEGCHIGVAAGQRGLGCLLDSGAAAVPVVDGQGAVGRGHLREGGGLRCGCRYFCGHSGRGTQQAGTERQRQQTPCCSVYHACRFSDSVELVSSSIH